MTNPAWQQPLEEKRQQEEAAGTVATTAEPAATNAETPAEETAQQAWVAEEAKGDVPNEGTAP